MRRRPASLTMAPATVVHLLALRPELRESFPIADVVDVSVRWGA